MQERFFPPQAAVAILLNQRIEEQAAIDTPMNDGIGRQLRLALFDHEPFAFLTGHGAHLLVMAAPNVILLPGGVNVTSTD
jgi:hypothetical protein